MRARASSHGSAAARSMTGAPRRYVILVNPAAARGRTRRQLPEVERALAERGLAYRVLVTTDLEDARRQALLVAEQGETPVSMGGDGLIGAIGGALAGSDTPLGVIPGGRGNDLARVLGIPPESAAAVDVLAAGVIREIDIGQANGRPFVGIASVGFDSDANRIANEAKLIKGNLVYAYAGIRALAAWKPARFTVIADGASSEFTGYTVAVANSKAYGGGMYMAPGAELDDGVFDLVLVGQIGKRRFLANLPKVFKGTHLDSDEVTVLRATRVEVRADRPFAVYADGEHLTDLPADLRILPRALRVIAPA